MRDLSVFFDLPQEALLSLAFDRSQGQEGLRLRALRRARKIAEALIDEQGAWSEKNLIELLESIEKQGWIYDPTGLSDASITEHQLLVLRQFLDPGLIGKLRQFQLPLCHRFADELIHRTLGIPLAHKLTVADLRRAVLSACLTPLRQNVGSCFATAPAILIQREQIEMFLSDLLQLLNTGRLTRVIEGVLHGVPLSPHTGSGVNQDLDNALLKSWEYTLASFSEVKMEFTQWNLYTGLGLHPEESGGIGAVIYAQIEDEISVANEKIKEHQTQYELAFDQLRATESLLKQASTEAQLRRLQAEYQSRNYHLQACLEMRDEAYTQGKQSSHLYSLLIEQYTQLFPQYFQEIYDADMQELNSELYEDRPAGFRLLYKHGREDPSLWTLIYSQEHYVQALVDFFVATESQIAAVCSWKGGREQVAQITSVVIQQVRSMDFIQSAHLRTSKAHASANQTPWAYTSGGTLTTLVNTYYRRAAELTCEEKWVENETELLIFLIDALKLSSPMVTDLFVKQSHRGMLANSPTHAFVLRPGFKLFAQGWQENGFTYTWVRDEIFTPSQQFFSQMRLTHEQQLFLFQEWRATLPLALPLMLPLAPQARSVKEYRDEILSLTGLDSQRALIDHLDAFLFQALPVVSFKEIPIYLRRLFSDEMNDSLEALIATLSPAHLQNLFANSTQFITAYALRALAKELYVQSRSTRTLNFDLHGYVADHARYVGLAPPTPLLVADSNWTGFYFGFVVNPGTGRLELWRLDLTAVQGVPMSTWQPWLTGKDRKTWAVFTKPAEYASFGKG